MTSIHQAFFEEASELLDGFEEHLLELERSPDDIELLNSIFRCAHSIKGGSATFGFPDLARFTHSLETLLDGVRNKEVSITKALCSLLLESLDQMRALLEVAKGEATDAPNSDDLIRRIDAATKGEAVVAEESGSHEWGLLQEPKLYELKFAPSATCLRDGCDPLRSLTVLYKSVDILTHSCDASAIPTLDELDLETCYLSWTIMLQSTAGEQNIRDLFAIFDGPDNVDLYALGGTQAAVETPEAVAPAKGQVVAQKSPVVAQRASQPSGQHPPKDGGTIKVSSEKLDTLINLVGELVISQSMLNAVVQDFGIDKMQQLKEAVAAMERSSRELQERVMGIRLLQMKMAFGRFPRLVHDLSSSVGKKIDLKLSGEETELDKNLIEAIGDPLTHLVRNSIDHGLEPPDERKAAGKSPVGTLTIGAFHEGGSIVIEIADDGRGLNRDKILAKAVERGLAPSDGSLSDEQIYNLIFVPGFSTAEQITDLSGRGVGMDIVKQAINAIGGSIKVTSKPGEGCCTRIRLPLTMAILEGQSMAVGEGVYIVPLTSIVESLRPNKEDIHSLGQAGEVVSVRGEYVPVLRLYTAFNLQPKVTEPWGGSLVLVESEGHKVALMADELIGQGQVVIKSLETNYRRVDGIAGATILGDGRVALIVDVPGLLRGTGGHGGRLQPAA